MCMLRRRESRSVESESCPSYKPPVYVNRFHDSILEDEYLSRWRTLA